MSNGMGIIVDKELNLWFSEPDAYGDCSHSLTIERLGWKENGDAHLRHFVRVQFEDWTDTSFQFDENETLPGWCENARELIRQKCVALLMRCASAGAEYKQVCDSARAEYEKMCAPARAEYEKMRDSARAAMIETLSHIPGYVQQAER